ncbi:YidH family protein [Rhodococcus sp. NPDC058505]|uniref:YidH family protein n=1 Tax=unclassified Rhodococcus (in: high G+C Gram-positive bacteria) TaxID=192944 RepID=UPI00365A88FA
MSTRTPRDDTGTPLDDTGREPDPRFTLANERTFLAWIRTALALVAAGVALNEFVDRALPGWITRSIALFLVAIGGALAVAAVVQWRRVQSAMRMGRPLPAMVAIPTLAALVAIVCVGVLVGVLVHG